MALVSQMKLINLNDNLIDSLISAILETADKFHNLIATIGIINIVMIVIQLTTFESKLISVDFLE